MATLKKRVYSTEEAAAYIGVAPVVLRRARARSAKTRALVPWTPPAGFQKCRGGDWSYLLEDLDAWIAAQPKRTFAK